MWFKKTINGAYVNLFFVYDGGGINLIFYDSDKLYSDVGSGSDGGSSDVVFRDTNGGGIQWLEQILQKFALAQ